MLVGVPRLLARACECLQGRAAVKRLFAQASPKRRQGVQKYGVRHRSHSIECARETTIYVGAAGLK